ncbi:MAG: hypothetical protein ACREI3_00965 [Nitrospirales bacterium]
MFKYLVLFALACTLSLALTPLVRRLAIRLGALNRPGERHCSRRIATTRFHARLRYVSAEC